MLCQSTNCRWPNQYGINEFAKLAFKNLYLSIVAATRVPEYCLRNILEGSAAASSKQVLPNLGRFNPIPYTYGTRKLVITYKEEHCFPHTRLQTPQIDISDINLFLYY